ncbi:4-hydroxythreonine-4-phosphate dehydrogenase PdxA [Desulfurivibrio dismutans]|uniref:4-hydroxythreonine-4-phosphate dehydrogenase PdxA n=1 Tax=Desulfurivibrio dismutans TaxID=1398908 RepID=UPI0023DC6CAA|nr:4-hydroxythreonine-4-phosphate dehydrogenase PdxA [Desulfurivibrio alkaliphilus]MDF1614686.1 4-hydroxythreonine-4-phosphate dehydrogenase PdxA [Desulfurivibrio alkaliphilus]
MNSPPHHDQPQKPLLIGITMGCPAGIGPEIILRLHLERELARPAVGSEVTAETGSGPETAVVVLGDPTVLAQCARRLDLAVKISSWQPGQPPRAGALNVLPVSALDPVPLPGRPTVESGRAMGEYITKAVALVQSGELAAMSTCPIGKDMLNAGGYHYPGHTEMLAALCNCSEYAMMMAGARLRVSLVSIHRSLALVPEAVCEEAVVRLLRLTARALQRDFAIPRPRLAVAALNPHAGEGGMFGDEERRIIVPAMTKAAALLGDGVSLTGPRPPDTVFYQASRGDFDAVVAMYHDQGLIPFKLLHFQDGVNVTIGLPIIRTSVDHGTAYDIAGRGVADPASLRAACLMAAEIAANRSARCRDQA